MAAEIIRLDVIRATRALAMFRAQPHRSAAVDTLYCLSSAGPLTAADLEALKSTGLAQVVRQRGSGIINVTLTPTGRRERDRETRKAR